MEDGKIHLSLVVIEYNNQVGALMQEAETLMLDLFGLIQEMVGITLLYVLAEKPLAVVFKIDLKIQSRLINEKTLKI